MSLFAPQLQVVSDLHLETPITNPHYSTAHLNITGTALFLLGDIGLVVHEGLFLFLRRLLDQNRGCRIFYVLGNHEAYQTTLERAVEKMRAFEEMANEEYGGRFHFLFRNRYDIDDNVTILGCTLWTNIHQHQATEVHARLTDFNDERGIHNWTPEKSCIEHARDLEWLNKQVELIQTTEPHRNIMIATHHCPTVDPRATDPVHRSSKMSSAFVSDLSGEPCWTAKAVKLWAFGHTHYSCTFRDEVTKKLLVSSQKGYSGVARNNKSTRRIRSKVVEARGDAWLVMENAQSPNVSGEKTNMTKDTKLKVQLPEEYQQPPKKTAEYPPEDESSNKPRELLIYRATKRVKALFRPRPHFSK